MTTITIQDIANTKVQLEEIRMEGTVSEYAPVLTRLEADIEDIKQHAASKTLLDQAVKCLAYAKDLQKEHAEEAVSFHMASLGATVSPVTQPTFTTTQDKGNLPGVGATNTHTQQSKEMVKMDFTNYEVFNNYKPLNTEAKETGLVCLLINKPEEGVIAGDTRIIPKENVIYAHKNLEAKYDEYGVHPSSRKALNKRIRLEKIGVVSSSAIGEFTKNQALTDMLNNNIIVLDKAGFRQYAVRSLSVDFIQGSIEDGDFEFKTNKVISVSESHLLNTIADGEEIKVEYSGLGNYTISEKAKSTRLSALNIAFITVDPTVNVRELEARIEKFAYIIENGVDINGEKFVYLMKSPSQERTMTATFIRVDESVGAEETAVLAKRALGLAPIDYAKETFPNEDGTFTYEAKSAKRHGLTMTSTQELSFFNRHFAKGTEVKQVGQTEMYEVIAKATGLKILVVPDFTAVIKHGEADILDGTLSLEDQANGVENPRKSSKFRRVKMEDINKEIEISDGGGYLDFKYSKELSLTLGYYPSAIQFREGVTKSKGMLNLAPVVEKTGYDMILPHSVVKGSLRPLVENPELGLTFRLAGAPKRAGSQKEFTNAPNQFAVTAGLSTDVSQELSKEQVARYEKIMNDPQALVQYLRQESKEELQNRAISEDHLETITNESIATKLHALLAVNPEGAKDVYLRSWIYNLLDESMKNFRKGQYEVKGNYKFMTHDFILFLEIVNYNLKNKNNPEKQIHSITEQEARDLGFNYIRPGGVVISKENGKGFTKGKALLARMPLVHPGELVLANVVKYQEYINFKKEYSPFLNNMTVFSAFDMNAFSMGGGDFDGDIALVTYDERIINSVSKRREENNIVPLLDITASFDENGNIVGEPIEGCPFVETLETPKLMDGTTSIKQLYKGDEALPKFVISKNDDSMEAELEIYRFERLEAANIVDNKIGIYTNTAAVLLDSIYHVEELLATTKGLNEGQINLMKEHIAQMSNMVNVLRLALGWDIDKAKHGGAFEEYLDLDFMENPPFYAAKSIYFVENGSLKRRLKVKKGKNIYRKLHWLQGDGGLTESTNPSNYNELNAFNKSDFECTNSLMHKQMYFNNKIWNEVINSEDGIASVDPTKANLLEEAKEIKVNPSVAVRAANEAKNLRVKYSKENARIREENKKVALETKPFFENDGFYNEKGHKESISKDYLQRFAKVAEKLSQQYLTISEFNSHLVGFDVAFAKASYLMTYKEELLAQNKEDLSNAKDVQSILNAAKKGLSFVYNIAPEATLEMFRVLGNADYKAAFMSEQDTVKGKVLSSISAQIYFNQDAVNAAKGNLSHLVNRVNEALTKGAKLEVVDSVYSYTAVTGEVFEKEAIGFKLGGLEIFQVVNSNRLAFEGFQGSLLDGNVSIELNPASNGISELAVVKVRKN